MFGLGQMEIIIIVALVVLVLGAGKGGDTIKKALRIYREVDKTKQELRSTFSLSGLFDKKDNDKNG